MAGTTQNRGDTKFMCPCSQVGSSLHIDGTISVAGQSSTSGTGGGGSGGSILIEAYNMSGKRNF